MVRSVDAGQEPGAVRTSRQRLAARGTDGAGVARRRLLARSSAAIAPAGAKPIRLRRARPASVAAGWRERQRHRREPPPPAAACVGE
eukprot:1831104-Prymnesium_polylepis.1